MCRTGVWIIIDIVNKNETCCKCAPRRRIIKISSLLKLEISTDSLSNLSHIGNTFAYEINMRNI